MQIPAAGPLGRLRPLALPAAFGLLGIVLTAALVRRHTWLAVVAGVLLTLLLTVLAARVQQARSRLESDFASARRDHDRVMTFLETVMRQVDVGIIACDEEGRITIVNDAAAQMCGGSAPTGTPDNWARAMAPGRREGTLPDVAEMPLHRALHGEQIDGEEFFVSGSTGEWTLVVSAQPLLDADGVTVGAVSALHDITARKLGEAEMRRLAMQDHLTGLANRRKLSAELRHALLVQSAGGAPTTVLFMDLDGFKQVNDSAGHHRGDQMLVDLAAALQSSVHDGDVAARVGGDEFVLLCCHCETDEQAYGYAAAMLGTLAPVLDLDDVDVAAGLSIGLVRPTGDDDVDDVLRFADLAMYEAKGQTGTSIHVYEPELGQRAAGRHAMEGALRRAVRNDDLSAAFQPIIDVASGRMVGAEALVRWQHGDELRSPAEFLPLAEATGLIVDVDLWMLGEACMAAVRPGMPPRVNVNLSAATLALPNLVGRVESALAAAGAVPGQLCLELTETALIGASDGTDTALAQLRDLGVGLALDDFGTGYASLGHLRRFPVDTVKIDRSFVRHVTSSAEDREIVSGTVQLAQRLGLTTVAEGVETPAQAALLHELGCERLQGYLLGRPMPLEDLLDLAADAPRDVRSA